MPSISILNNIQVHIVNCVELKIGFDKNPSNDTENPKKIVLTALTASGEKNEFYFYGNDDLKVELEK